MGRVVRGCTLLILPAMVALAGCATDDSPTGMGNQIKAIPSFAADIQPIFERRGCTNNSCHGTIAQAGLDLRAANSWAELVNVPSTQRTQFSLVRPGHAQDSSYLVDKLDGTGAGIRMPEGGAPLDSIDMQNIINWIHQGAFDN